MIKSVVFTAALSLLAAPVVAEETTAPAPAATYAYAPVQGFMPMPHFHHQPMSAEAQKEAMENHRKAMQARSEQMQAQHKAYFEAQQEYAKAMIDAQRKAAEAHIAMLEKMHGIQR